MKFEELQRQWNAVKTEPMSHEEYRKIIYTPSGWRLKKVTWMELLIFLRTVFFFCLVIYLFDGLKTLPGWMLTAYWAYVFLDEFVGLRFMSITPQRETLQKSLTEGLARIQRGATVSKVAHVVLWLLVVFSLGATHAGSLNMFWWAMILLPLLLAVNWWSSRKWSRKRSEIKEILEGLGEETTMPFGPVV